MRMAPDPPAVASTAAHFQSNNDVHMPDFTEPDQVEYAVLQPLALFEARMISVCP
jgi:hypothetical protein